jgi:carbamoyltransferase
MEFGPRALGARSILANPTLPDMKATLNARVKHREPFRPFAPSVVAEAKSPYFETSSDDPFMLKVCAVRPERRAQLPAVTHVDASARLQTFSKSAHPRYHALLMAMDQRTGYPVILNTSFNVMGQPIVESPTEAIHGFLATDIDCLAIGDFLLDKATLGRGPKG